MKAQLITTHSAGGLIIRIEDALETVYAHDYLSHGCSDAGHNEFLQNALTDLCTHAQWHEWDGNEVEEIGDCDPDCDDDYVAVVTILDGVVTVDDSGRGGHGARRIMATIGAPAKEQVIKNGKAFVGAGITLATSSYLLAESAGWADDDPAKEEDFSDPSELWVWGDDGYLSSDEDEVGQQLAILGGAMLGAKTA